MIGVVWYPPPKAGEVFNAKTQPIRHQAHRRRAGHVGSASPQIYVTVSRRHPRQDRPARLRRPAQRCHRRAARYAAADRQQVAPALLRRTLGRLEGRASRRAPGPLFPPASSSTLSGSPASCQPIGCALGALEHSRPAPRGGRSRDRGADQRHHALALAECRRLETLAAP